MRLGHEETTSSTVHALDIAITLLQVPRFGRLE
jgi:hypothetical protein